MKEAWVLGKRFYNSRIFHPKFTLSNGGFFYLHWSTWNEMWIRAKTGKRQPHWGSVWTLRALRLLEWALRTNTKIKTHQNTRSSSHVVSKRSAGKAK